ncbi:hypothetical protein B0H15DRAFT_767091 [Mycena belliarum]|uniref:Store-operated calcium entry-associated regulatory factor n=1 Tax=Mycena belliarum TaxID=1033014 RepID=A0AAD6XUP7_9AGAR|nr:hypothetical protein B0H15DRAFT_767091 [Mycena belliae]
MSRVRLDRIQALTFYQDSLTEARRTHAIPQLKCIGKPCRLYTPEVVRCQSLGGSETEIDWKCEADLPESLRFGKVEVSCEGWSQPGDPYFLRPLTGSCALEYRLVQVPGSLRNSDSDNLLGGSSSSFNLASTIFTVLWVAVVGIILYSFIQSCMRGPQNRVEGRPDPGRPGSSGSGSFPGGFSDNNSSPPPPYSKRPFPAASSEGWRPGFWSGASLGGLMTYLLNNRGNDRRAYDWERERSYQPPPPSGSMFGQRRSTVRYSQDRGEGSSNLGAMRQSTGFGGSSVR